MTTVVEFYIPDKERSGSIKLLSKHFDKKNCSRVEKGLFDFTEQYCRSNGNNLIMAQAIYKDCLKNVIYNCDQNHTTMQKIKKQIKDNNYNSYNLAFLKPEELDEDNWMKIILRRNTTEDKLKNLPTVDWKVCRNEGCRNTKYFYYQLQTRSADEPMTTFYICKKCERTYKVNN